MLKHINGWEISKKLESDYKPHVKHSSAQRKCMKDYLKPPLREDPNHFILHVETNDLITERSPELIAKSIVDMATMLKIGSCDVSTSKHCTYQHNNTK